VHETATAAGLRILGAPRWGIIGTPTLRLAAPESNGDATLGMAGSVHSGKRVDESTLEAGGTDELG
jgi:hypothetical protein